MAAYPTLPWMQAGTTRNRSGGLSPARASNGALKVRRLYPEPKLELQLEHWITDSEKTAFEVFYAANVDLRVDVTAPDDGLTYSMQFSDAPQYEWRVGFWVLRVRLLQV